MSGKMTKPEISETYSSIETLGKCFFFPVFLPLGSFIRSFENKGLQQPNKYFNHEKGN
jgi:hypothetical protein